MLQMIGNEIILTRGDNAEFIIELTDNTGVQYEMEENDVITLSVKKYIHSTDYIFQKTVTGKNKIEILPEDTKSLAFGKYVYDVQITTADGKIYTVISPSTFCVAEEVTV